MLVARTCSYATLRCFRFIISSRLMGAASLQGISNGDHLPTAELESHHPEVEPIGRFHVAQRIIDITYNLGRSRCAELYLDNPLAVSDASITLIDRVKERVSETL